LKGWQLAFWGIKLIDPEGRLHEEVACVGGMLVEGDTVEGLVSKP
jgi:hypothetical protein